MALFSQPPHSICLLRLSALGDCCHAVALVQAIQRQWPHARITWITGKLEAQLLQQLPDIEVIVFDKQAGWRGYVEIWQQLRGRQFDALLHMQAAMRASLLSLGIRARHRLGLPKDRAKDGQWLFTNHKVTSLGEHVVDGFMGFGKALGVTDLQPCWQFPLQPEAIDWARHYHAEQPLLLICPASSKAYKNWTSEGYAALAEHAHRQGMRVMLIGSPAPTEIELAARICTLTSHIDENLVGRTSLPQLLALISQASLVVAPDTGPAHMATMVGTPVIGLYAHHNPQRTGPYLCRSYVVSAYDQALLSETGKTAAQLPWRTRVKNPDAMQLISPEMVIARFDQVTQALAIHKEPS
ncbi:glycosyltransferase family 9 protein [Zobellella maritima]|uniref:glycosyltransferase family 9 protein n=1 Tax=Zobellella maritima TaxID=2059725 RepID=UPI000E302424|nr:glycosyltransferase family 9 protein [Zobellella maritima]